MQRRLSSRLLAAILTLGACAYADFAPSGWQYRKLIHVADERPANSVRIDRDIYFIAREDLADLRIVHGTDEVPFLLVTASSVEKERDVPGGLEDRVVTPAGVQAVVSFATAVRHNRLTIDSQITNFRHKVQLYSSIDGITWDLLKKDAYVFDFTADAHHASLLTIDYPTSTRRHLKILIEGAKDAGILAGASVHLREERPATWQQIAKFDDPRPVEDDERHATSYVLDFGAPGAPRDRLTLTIADPEFHRSASVEWSDNAKDWVADSFGTIYRTEGTESLVVTAGKRRSQYLRITLFHGDDKPLRLTSVSAEAVERRIVFPSKSAGDYHLYFGNPDARPPAYDLAMVMGKDKLDAAVSLAAEGREENPSYRPPEPPVKPLSERYPGLLYGVLGVAVLGLGYLTLRFMQGVKEPGAGG